MTDHVPQPVTVVGGVYHEQCKDPNIRRLAGSGLRAAGILASLGHTTTLITTIDGGTLPEAHGITRSLGIETFAERRSARVQFDYETPLASPTIRADERDGTLTASAQFIVAFGMLESRWTAEADRLVVDPQNHSLAECGLLDSRAQGLAVVLNAREACSLTECATIPEAGRAIVDASGAEVVVVKNGIRGAVVVTSQGLTHVGAHPTHRVWPIGSGDAFTAGFASAWSADGDPVAAAQQASRVAALACITGMPTISADDLDHLPPALSDQQATVYLAGPFFSVSQRWLVRHVRAALRSLGVEVFSPMDDVGVGGDEVAAADLAGLERSDAILALLDGNDPGTIFETGFATHANIPVVGFCDHVDDHNWTMLRGSGAEIHSDLATAVYRAGWAAISARATRS